MVDNVHDSAQPEASSDDVDDGRNEGKMVESLDNSSFGARLRVIILLSLLCWAVLIAGLVLLID